MSARQCVVPGCEGRMSARGLCRKHYSRWQRHGSTENLGRTGEAKRSVCKVDECTSVQGLKGARGYCSRHYQKLWLTGSPTGSLRRSAADRFFAKVSEGDSGCWIWTAACDGSGYGLFSGRPGGASIRAHIWSYEYLVAEVPEGLELDHLCRVRNCVNPWHLEPVTSRINSLRGESVPAKNARKTHCLRGHPFDEENTYMNPSGGRVCRTCMTKWRRNYQIRQEGAA